jgi:hypothetical protein
MVENAQATLLGIRPLYHKRSVNRGEPPLLACLGYGCILGKVEPGNKKKFREELPADKTDDALSAMFRIADQTLAARINHEIQRRLDPQNDAATNPRDSCSRT